MNHNIDLLLWICEKENLREELLRDWMVERMHGAAEKGQNAMQNVCKISLKEVNKQSESCPVVSEKMSFNIFLDCMSAQKSKKSGDCLSATSCGGVRSAFPHLHWQTVATMNFQQDLSQFMSGMTRTVAEDKRDKGANLEEGKKNDV